MLRDSAKVEQSYEVVIVGTGPAGMTLAMQLTELGYTRIALVESGGLELDDRATDLSTVTAEGDLAADYYPVHAQRALGGTSCMWAGWCVPLEQRAFEAGEWPFPRSEIDRWYPDACAALQVSTDSLREPQPVLDGHGIK